MQIKRYPLRIALDSDIPAIRSLVNLSYKELGDMNLNYTGVYQDEKITRERMQEGKCFVLENQSEIIATVVLNKTNYFTKTHSAYISQLAIHPSLKRQGLGSALIRFCEELAKKEGFESMQLDTAKPALHLVKWYTKMGYKTVGDVQWKEKNYESWIFEKTLIQAPDADNLH